MLATQANNHFGIKCHKEWNGPTYHMDDDTENECFRKYENPLESYKDHSLFLTTRPRYTFLFDLDICDYKAWAHGLKTAGYATNPSYAELLIKNIEEFELYKLDKNYVSKPKPMDSSFAEKEIKAKKYTDEEEYFDEITLGEYSRKVFKNNGVSFIYVKKGDTFQSISGDLDIPVWQLKSYNDLRKKDELTDGQAIYIQAKKNRGKAAFHTVATGETLYDISQQHAIKLKRLCKYNTLDRDAKLFPDQKIKLR
jgi:LysM repeat protein